MTDTLKARAEQICDVVDILCANPSPHDEVVVPLDTMQHFARTFRELLAEREWRPIETAPKDGTKVILYVVEPAESEYAISVGAPEGWANTDIGFYERGQWESEHAGQPTHWQPLPPPPKDKP